MMSKTIVFIAISVAALVVTGVVLACVLALVVFKDDDDDNSVAATMTTVMTTVTTAISNVFYDAVMNYPVPYMADFADSSTAAYMVLDQNITSTIAGIITTNMLTASIPSHTVQGFASVSGMAGLTEITVRLETNPTLVTSMQLQTVLTASIPAVVPGSTFVSLTERGENILGKGEKRCLRDDKVLENNSK